MKVTYTDIHGNQQKGFFNISVTDVFYWCNCIPENNSDSILQMRKNGMTFPYIAEMRNIWMAKKLTVQSMNLN